MKLSWDFIAGMLLIFLPILFMEFPDLTFGNPGGKENRISVHKDSLDIMDSLRKINERENFVQSNNYAKRALTYAKKSGTSLDLVKAYQIIAGSFTKEEQDSSFFYYSKALKIASNADLVNQKAYICLKLSTLYSAAYDYRTGIIYLDSTIQFAEASKEFEIMADAYNELGNLKFNIQDTASALQMFRTAFRIARDHALYKEMGVVMGNLATKFEPDITRSINLQHEAIGYLIKAKGAEEAIAMILINIGNRHSKPDSALYYYRKALNLDQTLSNPEIVFGAYNSMAYCFRDKGNIAKAEACLVDYAIPLAVKQGNVDWLSTLYDTYADILMAKGSYKEAVECQKKAMEKRIESDKRQAANQVRLLAALLDVKNKELVIQNKGKELEIQNNRLQKTRLWLIISVLLVIGLVFVTLWLQLRNRMRFQHQQIISAKRLIEMEEREKGRIARELHDITGQLILGITGAIRHLDLPEEVGKDELKDKIKELGRSIRMISHRMNKAMLEHFTFEELIIGQSADMQSLTGIQVDLEMIGDYSCLPEEMVLHTYRIIQELLLNASRYATDEGISLRIETRENILEIFYMDKGPGFDPKEVKDGIGIINIYERIKLLGGKAKVSSAPGSPTSWEISIPRKNKNNGNNKIL
ncbi:MAG: hypothetical protein NTX61_00755 [Bacteroidetes bacterium]|nr:hypothetical protein [Bacteroidota bacterium]